MIGRLVRGFFVMLAFVFGGAALAQSTRSGGDATSKQDQEFVTRATHANAAEITLGQLAQKNGSTDAVRQFGQRMIKDHTAAMKELESIAGKLGISPSKQPDPKHEGDAKMLTKATGAEFDRLYSGLMVRDHEMTVNLFERQSKSDGNAALAQFAAKQLPILQEHLKMARALGGQP
jgi:putative membrane protein